MALTTFPELADLVAADLYAGTGAVALSRARHLGAAHLLHARPDGAPARWPTFLRGPRVPTVLGFDPLFQFMHERRRRRRRSCTALEKRLRGVFNVAGPQPVPLSRA